MTRLTSLSVPTSNTTGRHWCGGTPPIAVYRDSFPTGIPIPKAPRSPRPRIRSPSVTTTAWSRKTRQWHRWWKCYSWAFKIQGRGKHTSGNSHLDVPFWPIGQHAIHIPQIIDRDIQTSEIQSSDGSQLGCLAKRLNRLSLFFSPQAWPPSPTCTPCPNVCWTNHTEETNLGFLKMKPKFSQALPTVGVYTIGASFSMLSARIL